MKKTRVKKTTKKSAPNPAKKFNGVRKERTRKSRKPRKTSEVSRDKKKALLHPTLTKHPANPILEPNPGVSWEAWQVFNPAALFLENRVHFIYRALGPSGLSVFGYASSPDGINIDERLPEPVYTFQNQPDEARKHFSPRAALNYFSGGSLSGCEDPRATNLDGIIYVTHTVFDSWAAVRIALSKIKEKDFLAKNWHGWQEPTLISPPGEIHKNWVIFPEKIKGKYAILHSISPSILVNYFDSLDFDGRTFIKSSYRPQPVEGGWEAYCRGAGPPPIKTKRGWLLLYQAIDKRNTSKYKIGAMILDVADPTKILYRAKEPVLEPGAYYENTGFKPGIVYSCGAVVLDGTLHLYYGGADTVVAVATAPLDEFVETLVKTGKPKLKRVRKTKIR